MLEIKYVRENIEEVRSALGKRAAALDFDAFIQAEKKRRQLLQEIETLRHQRNVVSDTIAVMKKSGQDADESIQEMRKVADTIKSLDYELAATEQSINKFMISMPNIPHPDVPQGLTEDDNRLERQVGTPRAFDFPIQAHWDLGESLGILDFARAAKITGARFPLYLGAGARLERALINFMLDIHINEHGYTEVLPPLYCEQKKASPAPASCPSLKRICSNLKIVITS